MSVEILAMLALLLLALALFIRETFPMEVTALGLLGVLLAGGVVSVDQALAGFSNRAVVAIGSLFVLSHALTKTGLLEMAAERLGHRVRKRAWLGIAALLGASALLSGFLNNTAIVAIFIPLAVDLCNRLGVSPSKVLIPLSYASIFGGTLTLIGTSTNLLVSSIALEAGQPPFSMFEFAPLGLILLALGLLYTLLFARRLLPDRVEAGDLTAKYHVQPYLTELEVVAGSKLEGRTLRELEVAERYAINVFEVLRGKASFVDDVGSLPLAEGDVLVVQGTVPDLLRLRRDLGAALLPDVKLSDQELAEMGQVTAEVLVAPASRFIGRTLAQLDFRHRVGGFVMALRRRGATLQEKIAQIPLMGSDTLLVLAPRERLENLRGSEDLFVLAELPVELRRGRAWWLVLAVLPLVVVLAATGVLEIAAGALLGAVVLLMAGAVTPQESYRSVNWGVLLLIAAFVPVGQAVLATGTADWLASGLLAVRALVPAAAAPWVLLSLLYLMTSLLTQMVSNAAAAIIVSPIALAAAASLGVDARPFLMAICFAASAEFMTPMGYQTNMMVFGPGGYRFLDYTRFGAPLNLLFWAVATLLIPWIWPF